jgi:hypothetical protein
MGARRWQAAIAAPILEAALQEKEPLEVEDAGVTEGTDTEG